MSLEDWTRQKLGEYYATSPLTLRQLTGMEGPIVGDTLATLAQWCATLGEIAVEHARALDALGGQPLDRSV